jgi:hypothetical protein
MYTPSLPPTRAICPRPPLLPAQTSRKADLLENKTLEKQWTAFLAKSGVPGPESFQEVLDQIAAFLGPLFERIGHR